MFAFQYLYGAVKRGIELKYSFIFFIYFNTYMVQLKVKVTTVLTNPSSDFNTYMVQLKVSL
ncbi:hypothetical protein MODO_2628 [Myroides odoratimimus]|nr:hypothetical protein MODO_2628 [Myroides odoratimimus]